MCVVLRPKDLCRLASRCWPALCGETRRILSTPFEVISALFTLQPLLFDTGPIVPYDVGRRTGSTEWPARAGADASRSLRLEPRQKAGENGRGQ